MDVVVSGSPVKEGKDKKEPDKWEIDCWVRTLTEAEEIKADPDKMKYVLPRLDKQVKVIKSLQDLRDLAATKSKQEKESAAEDEGDDYE